MGSGEDKNSGSAVDHQQNPQYGTFQGVSNYPPPLPPHHQNPQVVIGFPQPAPPPGARDSAASYHDRGYQTVPGYSVAEGRPLREPRLPCCGIGVGWFLFIIGFFLGAIPWYIGLCIILFGRVDYREKPGYIACTIAAILTTIAVLLGVTK